MTCLEQFYHVRNGNTNARFGSGLVRTYKFCGIVGRTVARLVLTELIKWTRNDDIGEACH